MAQSVEHVIGNDEVISSILITSSRWNKQPNRVAYFFANRGYLSVNFVYLYFSFRVEMKNAYAALRLANASIRSHEKNAA